MLDFVAALRDVGRRRGAPRGRRRRARAHRARATSRDRAHRHAVARHAPARRPRASRWSAIRRRCCSTSRPPASIPAQSADTRRLIRDLGGEHAVFVSSHALADVETLCDRRDHLHRGRVLADGDRRARSPRACGPRRASTSTPVAPPTQLVAALARGARASDDVERAARAGRPRAAAASRPSPTATCAPSWRPGSSTADGRCYGLDAGRDVARGGVPRPGAVRRTGVRKALVIARRELASMFGGPLAWVLGRGVRPAHRLLLLQRPRRSSCCSAAPIWPTGLWRYVFLDFRLVALLVVPLLTMRLVAEERKLGTLELLWTLPVRDREVLAGKFLAALAAYTLMLLPTLVGPAALYVMHPFALGPLLAGYTGMLLLGAAFIACGLAASAVTENQVVSAMLTYGVLVLSWFARPGTRRRSASASRRSWSALSLFDHFYGFAQGVIDSRDVVYFLAFAALFLFLALRALGARAWRGVV